MMDMKTEEVPAYRIAYIRQIGPYGTNNEQTMEALKKWANSKNLFHDESIILGIAQDDPEITRPENCRYDTCIVIRNDDSATDIDISEGNLAGGRYAVFQIDHTAEAVRKAWNDIFPELSKLGYQFDQSRPIIERYIAYMVNNHRCEICVPVY